MAEEGATPTETGPQAQPVPPGGSRSREGHGGEPVLGMPIPGVPVLWVPVPRVPGEPRRGSPLGVCDARPHVGRRRRSLHLFWQLEPAAAKLH